jgi:tetratricopeptide (TPR) repeat protein
MEKADLNKEIDSLERVLATNPHDTTKIAVLNKLGKLYLGVAPRQSIQFAQRTEEFAKAKGMDVPIMTYRVLANAHERLQEYMTALEYLQVARSRLEKDKDYEQLSQLVNYEALIYQRLGNYTESIEKYKAAEEIAVEYDLIHEKAAAFYGLATLLGILEDYEGQLDYYKRYLSIADPKHEPRKMAMAYTTYADIISEKNKQYDEAIDLYNKAFKIVSEVNDSIFMALVMNHMAWAFYLKGELETSLEYYQKNLDISVPLNRKQNITNIYGNIGNIYRDKKDYEKALEFYDRSIELSEEIKDFYNLAWIYEDISIMYASLGDYKKAFEYQQMHSNYSDSLNTHRYQSQLAQARSRYESEKNKQELEIVSLQLRNNRLITYGLGATVVIILIIGIMLFQRSRLKSNQKIAAMNHRISELNQQNLRQQMNPHFIFNTLNSIQYYVFQNDKIAANEYMSKFATLMRKILDNSRSTTIPLEDELDALKLYLELESVRFKGRFKWNIDVDDDIDTLDYKIPAMLIQPYVENAITHGLKDKEEKGRIDISIGLQNGGIFCSIKDDGIGRQKAMENKRKQNDSHNSLGTTITESRLKLVNDLYGNKMNVIYRDLKTSDGQPAGTEVIINIPIIT